MKKYIYPITIVICTLIIALTYLSVEIYKTNPLPNSLEVNGYSAEQCVNDAKIEFVDAYDAECYRLGFDAEDISMLQCIITDEKFFKDAMHERMLYEDICNE